MEINFLHADKHENFLQVDFKTLGIEVSCKVILSLLMGMIQYSQSTQSRKFALFQKRSQGWSSFFTYTSKFLQVGIIVYDGSGQTCSKYPK